MTWEETIEYIRTKPSFSELVRYAYFEEDLSLNVERFRKSMEFRETFEIVKTFQPNGKKILDIGCGNGISTIAFALEGYDVTAVEPDPSVTIGAGAIRQLIMHYKLENVMVHESFAEDIKFEENSFDIVYIRQAMHHANDLGKFVKEAVRVLKPNGLLLTIRDHVVFDKKDKDWFLATHPLHKYYGGENAFTVQEYRDAIENSGAKIMQELKYYDSAINYFPSTLKDIEAIKVKYKNNVIDGLRKKVGIFAKLPFVYFCYKLFRGIGYKDIYDERQVAGRMYSYIAIKL